MAVFTESYARLADDSYLPRVEKDKVNGTPFQVLRVIDRPSGYHGVISQHKETRELVVSHRGTEFDLDRTRDLAQADVQMALIKLNQQLQDARDAVELALKLAERAGPNGERVPITVTGHSLGGTLAQITAAEYGLRGETFNAYGAAGLYDTPAGGDLVVNHVRATDMVSAAGKHFGNVRVYATPFDEQMIYRDTAGRSAEIPFPLGLAPLHPGQTHGMDQFHGESSIIRPENVQRYAKNNAVYDEYRQDIREAALGVRYGMPLVAAVPVLGTPILNLYAYEAASYVSHSIGRPTSHENTLPPTGDDKHWSHKLEPAPAPPIQNPPLRACPEQGWEYEAGLQHIGSRYQSPSLQSPPPGASTRELFEHMCAAMETGDDRTFKQALATVADAPSNREFWGHISASVDADMREAALQTQVREQAQQLQQMQQMQMERQGPVMSLGFSR